MVPSWKKSICSRRSKRRSATASAFRRSVISGLAGESRSVYVLIIPHPKESP
nr:MAG TPA: hypothetical protein [Caudoviricetes sp.]